MSWPTTPPLLGSEGPIGGHPSLFSGLCGHVISVEGTIAVGKTSLCNDLAHLLSSDNDPVRAILFLEEIREAALCRFLDPKTRNCTAALFQVAMLSTCETRSELARALIHGTVGVTDPQSAVAVVDRSAVGNLWFALTQRDGGGMTADDMEFYRLWIGPQPESGIDAMIYMDMNPTMAVERMRLRDSLTESDSYDMPYFERLYRVHVRGLVELLLRPTAPPVLVVPTGSMERGDTRRVFEMMSQMLSVTDSSPPFRAVVSCDVPPEPVISTRAQADAATAEILCEDLRSTLLNRQEFPSLPTVTISWPLIALPPDCKDVSLVDAANSASRLVMAALSTGRAVFIEGYSRTWTNLG